MAVDKLTRWEKYMQKSGYSIINFTHEEIMEHLLQVFYRDFAHLTALAASDETNRHKLCIILDYESLGDQTTIFGGTVFYDKKKRQFTHISYSDRRNWAVLFSIESRVSFSCYDHYQSLKHIFPYGASTKKLKEYLLTN